MTTSSHTVAKAYIALRSRYVYLFEAFRGEEHSCAATDHRVKEAGGQQRPAAAARIMHASAALFRDPVPNPAPQNRGFEERPNLPYFSGSRTAW